MLKFVKHQDSENTLKLYTKGCPRPPLKLIVYKSLLVASLRLRVGGVFRLKQAGVTNLSVMETKAHHCRGARHSFPLSLALA